MRAVKLVLGLGAALAVHAVGTRLVPDLPRVLDLFLVVAVLNGLAGSSVGGLLGGAAAGLTHDVLSGRLYGLHGFADTIVGYAAARAAQRLDLAGPGAVLVAVALATLLEEAILVLLALLFTDPEPPEPLWVVIEALANGTVGALLFVAGSRFGALRDSARKRRMAKIRL
ncbi:MAG TPA: rod shape-determining protein MreD [Thermoanaerobaculia bacterium]|nr:rod shape-determining protein MreD [Thermoanaerobaculia bacterium]